MNLGYVICNPLRIPQCLIAIDPHFFDAIVIQLILSYFKAESPATFFYFKHILSQLVGSVEKQAYRN